MDRRRSFGDLNQGKLHLDTYLGPTAQLRRPKSREVTSRYLSPSSSLSSSTSSSSTSSSNSSNSMTPRRCASPIMSKTMATTPSVQRSNQRSRTAERTRPTTPRAGPGQMLSATKLLLSSTRSLSVSFQGESFSMRKAKPAPAEIFMRKGTPERRKATPSRDQRDHSSIISSDHLRWPTSSRSGNSCFFTKSLDYGGLVDKGRLSASVNLVKTMQKSTVYEKNRNYSKLDLGTKVLKPKKKVDPVAGAKSGISVATDAAASNSDSVSSWSNSSLQECGTLAQVRGGPCGIVVPARFLQETSSSLGRGSEPCSPCPLNAPKLIVSQNHMNDSPGSSPPIVSSRRGLSSPLRGEARPLSPSNILRPSLPSKALRPQSPCKVLRPPSSNSPSRGMTTLTKTRNVSASLSSNNFNTTPSILGFTAHMGRGKNGLNRIADAHELRILHNRLLQWQYVNARAEHALMVQTGIAKKSLYNAWVGTLKLWDSVRSKRLKLQQLSHNLKLHMILKGQVSCLENWATLEGEHINSLSGAIEALETSTVYLPVVGGVRVSIQEVENAICSAMDMMQIMAPSICFLLTKVEQVETLISELASLTTDERNLLYQCKDFLSKLIELEVKDCSLRVHMLELAGSPQSSMAET